MKRIQFSFSLFIYFAAFSFVVNAQNCPTRPTNMVAGGFTVTPITACVGQPITVTNTATGATNLKYTYNLVTLADTAKGVTATTFTYTAIGRYLIVQTGRLNGQRSFACTAINVVANPAITFSATSCGNATVRLTVNNTASLPYTAYAINWGDGSAAQAWTSALAAPVHTYASSTRAYTIQITGTITGATCTGTSAPQNFTPVGTAPIMPTWISSEAIDANTAELIFTTPTTPVTGTTYTLQQKIFPSATLTNVTTGVFTSLGGGQYRYRVPSLQINNNTYIYVLTQTSQCSGTPVSISSLEMPVISAAVTTQNYQNAVSWRPFSTSGLTNFQVLRDGNAINTTANATTFQYIDTQVKCAEKYSYQVVSTLNRTPVAKMLSQKMQVTTMPTALPPTLANVSVNVKDATTNSIVIVAPPAPTRVADYWIRTSDGRSIISSKTIINDSLASTKDKSICYTINYHDVCNRQPKDSIVVCSIFLEAKGETLKWTGELPIGGKTGTTDLKIRGYNIERLDNQGRVTKTNYVAMNTEWDMDLTDNNQEAVYRVRALAATGATTAVSNIVNTYRPMKLYVPDIFTPNGDRINEKLVVQGVFVKEYKLTIVNRTGLPVYQSTSLKDSWDGLIDGQPARSDTYGYIIQATDLKGKVETIRGTLQLLR